MINLLPLDNFCPVTSHPTSSKRKRRIVVYGLVTRYGPRSELPAQVVKLAETKSGKFVTGRKSKLYEVFTTSSVTYQSISRAFISFHLFI